MPFQFTGHPKYLEAAGSSLGHHARVVDRARRQPAVGECAGLLAQSLEVHPAARREILMHARERVDALHVAYLAALAMHDEVRAVALPPEPSRAAEASGVEPAEAELSPEPTKARRHPKG